MFLLICTGIVQAFSPYRNFHLHRHASLALRQPSKTNLFSSNDKKSFASISSDGVVSGGPRPTGSLGKPSKKKNTKKQSVKANTPLSKKERQRTANGTIQSEGNVTGNPADQAIQVVRGNRGNKTVTIVRGMIATPADEKKKILKSIKSKLGVGGTVVDGVLEIQGGSHAEKVVEILKGLGYSKTRKVGK